VRRPCTHARNQECVLAEVHQSPGAPRPSGGVPLADSLTRATKRGKSSSLKRQVTTSIHSSPALVSATRVRSVFGHNVEREGSPALQAAPALSSGKLWLVHARCWHQNRFFLSRPEKALRLVCLCVLCAPAGRPRPTLCCLTSPHARVRTSACGRLEPHDPSRVLARLHLPTFAGQELCSKVRKLLSFAFFGRSSLQETQHARARLSCIHV
jgi:hypothetical protein